MQWKYVNALESEDTIREFENEIGYSFPNDYLECVKSNNAGYPELEIFISWRGKRKRKRALKRILSFNKGDRETVWNLNDFGSDNYMVNYVAFGIDNFGNLICFDKTNDHIVFIDHETMNVEAVADSFREFINSLCKK